MPHQRKSETSALIADPLSLAAAHNASQLKTRAKSTDSAEKVSDHFSGVIRVGRVMASIFDRGKHMKYDYHVSERERQAPRNSALANAYVDAVGTPVAQKTSRTSSITTVSTAAGYANPANNTSTESSSRRSSTQSVEGRRQRRGGMSFVS